MAIVLGQVAVVIAHPAMVKVARNVPSRCSATTSGTQCRELSSVTAQAQWYYILAGCHHPPVETMQVVTHMPARSSNFTPAHQCRELASVTAQAFCQGRYPGAHHQHVLRHSLPLSGRGV
jgi:hypothetical protein